MNNQYTYNINKDKLNGSIETLSDIDNCINNTNLSDNFIEIEEIIKTVNFDHNNCILNYKEDISFMIDELAEIRKKISDLTKSLSNTVVEFSSTTELKSSDVENILNYYNEKRTSGSNISFDSSVLNAAQTSVASASTNSDISAVPVGLGIAATGLTASVGAVVVDSMNDEQKDEDTIEEYKESNVEEKFNSNSIPNIEQQALEFPQEEQKNEEVVLEVPYFANKNDSEVMNKFYDNDNENK